MVLLAVFTTLPFILTLFFSSPGAFFSMGSSYFFSRHQSTATPVQEIRIVGDIMLGRHVESLMNRYGGEYPYQNLETGPGIAWIGNFEATVPDEHRPTPNYQMRFSVNSEYLDALHDFGFTHLSLANNHSFDYGPDAYEETVGNLSDFDVFGHPHDVSEESITYTNIGDVKIGMLALSYVDGKLDTEGLADRMYSLNVESDIQIAYIHWGDEYESLHNMKQEELAHALIDDGIDMVVGHHPHVVQDVALYKGKPIFYSLGNFIFDQYFDQSVMEGLMIALSLGDDGELSWDLIPISSTYMAAAPRVMEGEERERFLSQLAQRSEPSLFVDILDGNLTFAY